MTAATISVGYVLGYGHLMHAFETGSAVSLCGETLAPGTVHHEQDERHILGCEKCKRIAFPRA